MLGYMSGIVFLFQLFGISEQLTTFVKTQHKMNAKEQCCSLEQSKRLAELGVTALSEYLHMQYENVSGGTVHEVMHSGSAAELCMLFSKVVSQAYTVAELARPVTGWMNDYNFGAFNRILVNYTNGQTGNAFSAIYNPSYLADCLIYLLENNLLTAAEVNASINA